MLRHRESVLLNILSSRIDIVCNVTDVSGYLLVDPFESDAGGIARRLFLWEEPPWDRFWRAAAPQAPRRFLSSFPPLSACLRQASLLFSSLSSGRPVG